MSVIFVLPCRTAPPGGYMKAAFVFTCVDFSFCCLFFSPHFTFINRMDFLEWIFEDKSLYRGITQVLLHQLRYTDRSFSAL